MSIYSERMLQISDNVPAKECGGRLAHKKAWMEQARMEIWRECSSIEEFARRGALSKGKAEELDAHYSKVLCVAPIKVKKIRGLDWLYEGLASFTQ